MTKVHYCDFNDAIKRCMEEGVCCFVAKSDMKSAFRNLGIKRNQWNLLILMAKNPLDGQIYYFIDKCLPFGAAISCSHFQRVSDAIAFLATHRSKGKIPINYLDDYFFAALMKSACNWQVQNFLDICQEIKFPVSMEKTFWGTNMLTFLGLLIDTIRQLVCIPADKVKRAQELIQVILPKKKTTVKELQKLCGFLNFLCKCIVPGRAFTRRLYANFNSRMKPHYHLNVTREMKSDLKMWEQFLLEPTVYCRPFLDFNTAFSAKELDWYTDASGKIGIGGICGPNWFQQRWSEEFLHKKNPSIEYQELFAVTVSVLLWVEHYKNIRICLFCDNESVVAMINTSSTKCKNCMVLIRKIVLHSMIWNVRVFAKWISTDKNIFADALSRFQMNRFWKDVEKQGKVVNAFQTPIPTDLWPVEKLWIN